MDVKKEEYCQNTFFCFTQEKESHAQFEITWRWVNYLFCSLNIMPAAMRTQIGLVLTSQQWHLTDTIFYMPPKQPYFWAPMIPEVFQNQSFVSKHVITQRDYFLCPCKSYVLIPSSIFELNGSRQTQLIWSKTEGLTIGFRVFWATHRVFFLVFFLDCHKAGLWRWGWGSVSGKATCCSWGKACVWWRSVGWPGGPWLPCAAGSASWRGQPFCCAPLTRWAQRASMGHPLVRSPRATEDRNRRQQMFGEQRSLPQ